MSIQGPSGAQMPPGIVPRPSPHDGVDEGARQGRVQTPTPGTDARTQVRDAPQPQEEARTAGARGSLPADAPPGTDPDLWSVLTSEERAYFSRARAMGPVTYGQGKLGLAEMSVHRGGRLDVRV